MKKLYRDFRRLIVSVPPLVASLLIISVVGMNLMANKSINTGLDWLALDCGILFSWLTFMCLDVLTHCYGPRTATAMSLLALLLNLLMAGLFFLASVIPGVWGESFVEGSEALLNRALNKTFGGTWYIIFGSSVAFGVSAALNNFLNHGIGLRMRIRGGFRQFALRSYISTFAAQFVDNLTFALIVSRVFFGWSLLQCFTCALTGGVMELLFEVFFSPLGYRWTKGLAQAKEEDLPEDEDMSGRELV